MNNIFFVLYRDKPQEWLTKLNSYDISKFSRLDVLIGRHGVGVDLNGKYFSMIFRDSERTSSFLEFFMCKLAIFIYPYYTSFEITSIWNSVNSLF